MSLAASALYIIDWAKIDKFENMLFGGELRILFLDRTAWCLLVVIALFNAGYICFSYFVRAWEFKHLAAKPVAMEDLEG